MKKIRIVIPTYNSERTIRKTLDAVYKSTFKDFEVVVVDDCSKDNTANIAKEYPCTVMINQRNEGAGYSRNQGARGCKCEYLLFIDSDVIIKPETIKELVIGLGLGVESVIGRYTIIPETTGDLEVYHNLYQCYHFFICNTNPYTFWTGLGLVSTKAFNEIGGFNELIGGASIEDDIFGFELGKRGYKIHQDKNIEVKHNHIYSFKSFVKSYWKRAQDLVKLVVSYEPDKTQKKSGYVDSIGNLLVLILLSLSMLGLILFLTTGYFTFNYISLFSFLAYLLLNLDFYVFILSNKGLWFTLKSVAINVFCNIITIVGAGVGIIREKLFSH